MADSDIKQIKQALQGRIFSLVRDLAGAGDRKGIYFVPKTKPDGAINDRGSFFVKVWGVSHNLGNWQDKARANYGDVFNLIAFYNGFPETSQKEAIAWAVEWLGGSASFPERKTLEEDKEARQAQQQAEVEKLRKDRLSAARWFARGVPIAGTLAENYLNLRGILWPFGKQWPAILKYFPEVKHSFSGKIFPCLMAGWTNPQNTVCAVHRTFLNGKGTDKANVDENRLSWPSPKGCVIRLGALNKTKSSDLKLVEGVEDGLSTMLLYPESVVWCFGSHGNIRSIKLPKVKKIILFADNDHGNLDAEKSVKIGLQALRSQNENVELMHSPIGKDANDLLRSFQKFS